MIGRGCRLRTWWTLTAAGVAVGQRPQLAACLAAALNTRVLRDPRRGKGWSEVGDVWPEPYSRSPIAHSKDGVEMKLNVVCAGAVTLSGARGAVRTKWTMALQVTGIGWPSPTAGTCRATRAACPSGSVRRFPNDL